LAAGAIIEVVVDATDKATGLRRWAAGGRDGGPGEGTAEGEGEITWV